MTSPSPKVTICIPAYNHGRFLRAALESAAAQTFADCEILVADNCSSDDTTEIVQEFSRRDARVRYEPALQHIGMAENFNRCLSLARGEYVKFLCADDLLEPRCVERLLALMEDGATLAASARTLFSDESPVVRIAR
jgi:glycosyltransferase involved in cell wall biosynthesis